MAPPSRRADLLALQGSLCAQIVNNETGAVLKTINGDTEPVTSLVWGPRMESMVVASRSLQVRSFSVESGKVLKHFRGHRAPVAHMAIDGSQTLLATAEGAGSGMEGWRPLMEGCTTDDWEWTVHTEA